MAAGLDEMKTELQKLSVTVESLAEAHQSSDAELTVTKSDLSALQGNVKSLQALTAATNSKMAAFSGLFRKMDQQLQEMWAEMDTVNNNMHHVMHQALEYQQQNEHLFSQLADMRNQLLAAFPAQLRQRSPPRPARVTARRRSRLVSEHLCEIDDLSSDELTSDEQSVTATDLALTATDLSLTATDQTPPGTHLLPADGDPAERTISDERRCSAVRAAPAASTEATEPRHEHEGTALDDAGK